MVDYDDYQAYSVQKRVDWGLLAEITPFFLLGLCWLVWLAFLLIPALFGLHGSSAYSWADNGLYVLMGLTFCTTIKVAIQGGHGVRAVFFALSLFVLCYWF